MLDVKKIVTGKIDDDLYKLSNEVEYREESVVWDFIGGEPFLEIELIIFYEEVVQVSSNLLCRNQFSSEVNILAFGKGRERLGNHTHLYATGNA